MSIIACPKCGSKISSLAKMCLHCGHVRNNVGDDESPELRQRELRDKVYHLKMTSYAVLAVLIAGFCWFWWGSSGFQHATSRGPFILMGLSAAAYVIVRGLLFRAQRKYKEAKRLVR